MSTGKIGKSQIRPVSGLSPGVLLPVRSTMVTSHINTARLSDSVRVGNEKQAKKRAREGSAEGTPKVPKPKHNPKPKPMPNHNPNINQGCPNHNL